MMYTVNIGFRTDRLYSRTEKVEAESKEEAKRMVWQRILADNPTAIFTDANARASKRTAKN